MSLSGAVVLVTIPTATANLDDEIFVFATSVTDASVTNFASGTLRVEDGADCNCNGEHDQEEIRLGSLLDCDANGVLDECEDVPPKLVASDAAEDDLFGASVSLDHDLAVIGAPFDVHSGLIFAPGSAYVYRREAGHWIEEAKLTAADADNADRFGAPVCIQGGLTVVGAPLDIHSGLVSAGAAYVFRREGTSWVQEAKLTLSNPVEYNEFGSAVSLDGDVVLVGSGIPGAGHVFRREGTTWIEEAELIASDAAPQDLFGQDASLSGNLAVIGAQADDHSGVTDAGSAYVFRREGTTWVEEAKLTASDAAEGDWFGQWVSLDGELAVVGAPYADPFGQADAGAAYVFRREGTTWVQEAKLTASNASPEDLFGSVSIDVELVVVGAMSGGFLNSGSAYLFRREGTTWIEVAKLTAPDVDPGDGFGGDVSINGHDVLVGSTFSNPSGLYDAGSAYVFPLPDCNANGSRDTCDIAVGTSSDCNANSVPDECDISRQVSTDCNDNETPDECEPPQAPQTAPYPHDRRKNRYISFDPNKTENDCMNIAFKVELLSINMGSCNDGTGGPVDFCRVDRHTCTGSGNDCTTDSDCAGECSNDSSVNCDTDADCWFCTNPGGGVRCTTDSQCGSYTCDRTGTCVASGQVCIGEDCNACSGSGATCISAPIDCPPGETCSSTGAVCVNDAPYSGGSNIDEEAGVWWVGEEMLLEDGSATGVHLLVSEPFRKVSTDWPNPVHVGDCEIVPRASYGVRGVAATPTTTDSERESGELVVETTQLPPASPPAPYWWGDVVGALVSYCNGDIRESVCSTSGDCGGDPCERAWELPNGVVNFNDVAAALWTSAPAAPDMSLGSMTSLHSTHPLQAPHGMTNSSII